MEKLAINKEAYMEKFKGFSRPNTTPTPDEVFDIFMTQLTHAELRTAYRSAKYRVAL